MIYLNNYLFNIFLFCGKNKPPYTWDSYKLRFFRLHSKTRSVKLPTDFFFLFLFKSDINVSSKAALQIALPPWDNICLFPKHPTPFHFIIKNISHVEAKDPAAINVTFDDTPYVNKKRLRAKQATDNSNSLYPSYRTGNLWYVPGVCIHCPDRSHFHSLFIQND